MRGGADPGVTSYWSFVTEGARLATTEVARETERCTVVIDKPGGRALGLLIALGLALVGVPALFLGALSALAYALAGGRAGHMLSARRVKLLSKISGGFLVGGGVWLALSRAR